MHAGENLRTVLITGATGFVGSALRPALIGRGYRVRGTTRRLRDGLDERVEWVEADLDRPETLDDALRGVHCAFYLVHSMGGDHVDFAAAERRCAQDFAACASRAGVQRIVYLGGPAPRGRASPHLASRLQVGSILRASAVPTIELRASMIMGHDSASWQIVRDLSLRLPAMILPKWLDSRTCPVALDDVVVALADAVELDVTSSAWFDIPGPEALSAREVIERIVALCGRSLPAIRVPILTPRLSALWLKLVSRANFSLARELVLGLEDDILPRDDRYWGLTNHGPRISFDETARRLLASEGRQPGWSGLLARVEESLVQRLSPKKSDVRRVAR
ncbi:MAG: NAD-dependent epimerase/dehydratase family protein [Deltaproteobacteria bacterium]|nr:NAD-dependent epimerase/dehydratase family protein [Deltaproteobacteria bacterium]